jgi:hypothetical protein
MYGVTMAMLAFGAAGILAIYAAAPAPSEPVRVAALATVDFSDDDGGRALFDVGQLAPDRPVSNCLRIAYDGAAGAGTVRLMANNVSGPLADALTLRLEMGTGGQFGDCTGFVGTQVYNGTLAGLGDSSAAEPGVATGWSPSTGAARTYRLTAIAPDDAAIQGLAAAATLTWVLVTPPPEEPKPEEPKPEEPSPEVPSPEVPSPEVPSPEVPSPEVPSPDAPMPVSDPPTEVVATPADPTEPDAAAKRGTLREELREVLSTIGRVLGRTGEVAAELAVRSAGHGAFPLASVGALGFFLIAQNRFDRRDPKLALAPVTREPYLRFDDPDTRPNNPSGGSPIDRQEGTRQ